MLAEDARPFSFYGIAEGCPPSFALGPGFILPWPRWPGPFMPMDLRRSRSEKKRKEKKRHRVLSKSESTRWVGVLDVRVLPRVQGDQMHPSPLSPKVVEVKCSSKLLAARDSPVLHIPHRLIGKHLKGYRPRTFHTSYIFFLVNHLIVFQSS